MVGENLIIKSGPEAESGCRPVKLSATRLVVVMPCAGLARGNPKRFTDVVSNTIRALRIVIIVFKFHGQKR